MSDMHERYALAEQMLPHNLTKHITAPRVDAMWLKARPDAFWYRRPTDDGGVELVLVDAAAKTAEVPDDVSFIELPPDLRPGENPSPDGRWAVGFEGPNLYVREIATDEVRVLTTDGEPGLVYGGHNEACAGLVMQQNLGFITPPAVVWSPDYSRFVTHKLDQRQVGLMHLVRSSPFEGGRPQLLSYHYGLPEDPSDELAHAEYVVFDAATGTRTDVDLGSLFMPFVTHIGYGWVRWSEDGKTVHFLHTSRGDHDAMLYALDADTGKVRVLVEEHSESHILFGPQQQDNNVRVLSTGEVLWWSQRTDWGHLYLYDADGSAKPLTSGEWNVRHVVSVDEDARRVLFTAAGRVPGSDPYLQELCAVSLDTGEITQVTDDGLDHDVKASPGGAYLVDCTSRWDTPTVSVLRDRSGAVVMELERSDASALFALGWTVPERHVVKAADGVTDLTVAIYKPFGFDEAASYPVIDAIYPGPQITSTPLRFPLAGGTMLGADFAANVPWAWQALGFAVVFVDARGTSLRSKSFQDVSRETPDGAFADDHIAAITQLAETRPWLDLERVGIMGYSAGGYASTHVMLQRPGFFKACVSTAGNHDNRLNHSWWADKFFGTADVFDLEKQANPPLAANLEGKLLLIHGEMDDNAVPHGTMRLADALIKANKDFDLMILPNADHHMAINRAWFIRRRFDWFVENLMGETPPKQFPISEIPNRLLG